MQRLSTQTNSTKMRAKTSLKSTMRPLRKMNRLYFICSLRIRKQRHKPMIGLLLQREGRVRIASWIIFSIKRETPGIVPASLINQGHFLSQCLLTLITETCFNVQRIHQIKIQVQNHLLKIAQSFKSQRTRWRGHPLSSSSTATRTASWLTSTTRAFRTSSFLLLLSTAMEGRSSTLASRILIQI